MDFSTGSVVGGEHVKIIAWFDRSDFVEVAQYYTFHSVFKGHHSSMGFDYDDAQETLEFDNYLRIVDSDLPMIFNCYSKVRNIDPGITALISAESGRRHQILLGLLYSADDNDDASGYVAESDEDVIFSVDTWNNLGQEGSTLDQESSGSAEVSDVECRRARWPGLKNTPVASIHRRYDNEHYGNNPIYCGTCENEPGLCGCVRLDCGCTVSNRDRGCEHCSNCHNHCSCEHCGNCDNAAVSFCGSCGYCPNCCTPRCKNEHNFRGKPDVIHPRFVGIELEVIVAETTAMKRFATQNGGHVGTDSSIISHRDFKYGAEFRFPPMQGLEFRDYTSAVESVLVNARAEVNTTCGLHVHVDMRGTSTEEQIGAVITYMNLEELLYRMQPKSRRLASKYCKPWRDFLGPEAFNSAFGHLVDTDNVDEWFDDYFATKYLGLNLLPMSKLGTFEFRMGAGTIEYEKITKWSSICAKMMQYGVTHRKDALRLCDRSSWEVLDTVVGGDKELLSWADKRLAKFGHSYKDLSTLSLDSHRRDVEIEHAKIEFSAGPDVSDYGYECEPYV